MAKNFAYSLVATAPSPATTGTSLVVTGGDGTKFPTAPFQATIWPTASRPTAANAEIVTVTGVSTDTLTIVRAQEGSSARTVIVGDQIAATVTAGVIVQSHRYDPLTAALQDITLDRSTDFAATDMFEVGSANSLEVPATSTLEPVPTVKQAEVLSYFSIYDFIESGCVWTADAAASTLLATMTDGYVWISGRRLRVNCVRSRTFTASKDTYVDFSDNGDGTAKVTYTENTNNLSTGSPTLAQGSLRNAVIVSGATNIAAATSINQGQESMLVPIVSSVAYSVTDSLGNLICPRDPNRKVLGYKQITGNVTITTPTTATLITGLSCPVIVPTGRKVKASFYCFLLANSTANPANAGICLTSAADGNRIQQANLSASASGTAGNVAYCDVIVTPATNAVTYVAHASVGTGNIIVNSASVAPTYIKIELV